MSIKKMLLTLMMLFAFSSNAMADTDFVKSAIQMGSSFCPGVKFDCENLMSQRAEISAAANKCIDNNYAITEPIMSDFKASGEFENCVTPDHPYKNSRGTSMYAICCVKKSDNNECEMNCTRYVDQK